MKRSLFNTAITGVLTIAFLFMGTGPGAVNAQPENRAAKGGPEYVAYYFYTSKRCGPCTRIEQWSREAVEQNFQNEIKSGKLQWQAVNVDKPENKHFIEDFKLYTKSLIIADYDDGQPARWENLKNVWRLYRDKEKYFDYVALETRKFMESD
ncbi:MAG: nitrophenyl compound nitroreductase subunit ArsF family protein [Thermodesulfobacteriota bacterium]|nr:nitrophenyl compound nitroreductase subunit ArsF family protein [Thermodesulfobacteriota bacterium]